MTTFPSKVDAWLGILLAALLLLAIGVAVSLQLSGSTGDAIVGWISLAAVVALYAIVVWPVRYDLGDDALVVRFGLMKTSVPYQSIRGVKPSRSIIAAPALSMDRLAIDTGRALPLLVSPADRAGFIDALASRVPNLERGEGEDQRQPAQ